jgi:hypothetical protein
MGQNNPCGAARPPQIRSEEWTAAARRVKLAGLGFAKAQESSTASLLKLLFCEFQLANALAGIAALEAWENWQETDIRLS